MLSAGVASYNSVVFALLFATTSWPSFCAALPSFKQLLRRGDLWLDYSSPTPSPEDGPPLSANAIRDPAYLPYHIGAIVGAYGVSLIIIALLLLALLKTRRIRIRNGELPEEERGLLAFNTFTQQFLSEEEYKKQLEQHQNQQFQAEQYQAGQFHPEQFQQEQFYPEQQQLGQSLGQKLSLQTDLPPHTRNYSLPSASPLTARDRLGGPLSPAKSQFSIATAHSPTSTILACGIDLSVDQTIVGRDRAMAQNQLEEMYRHVMEQERAKAEGRAYEPPPMLTSPSTKSVNTMPPTPGSTKRERNKPSNLNLAQDNKKESRGSSLLSFLKSPRKNKAQGSGMVISSPILTPMSGTFPRHDEQEMNPIPPRHYAPPAPPPVPQGTSDLPFRRAGNNAGSSSQHLPTPDISPVSTQSIDSRIDAAVGRPLTAGRREPSHNRDHSAATDAEPPSATSSTSTSGLVGLPTSPKPGVNRFPSLDSLPASPRPGQQSFSRPNAPSAVRAGGALPFRAYEPAVTSPSAASFGTTKQTVFTRADPNGALSPGMPTGGRTPWTGAPVPYTPYQPFSPVIPVTPSLMSKADRKRMRKLEPKTPTLEMVRDTDDVW
ncbi:hypothetical protein B0T21DRAFT_361137 [Apiosordaria backusii]|uniref:Uncharacterized protein n=1 Tax=Apiosordaria backusii TaxID=314023 RepID=A0AA40EN15_9PEZI|nr:hypothetical protein B0T21DRAFT_361137 [Apiosordaria backusii]